MLKNKKIVRTAALLFVASTLSFAASAGVCDYLGILEMPFFCPAP